MIEWNKIMATICNLYVYGISERTLDTLIKQSTVKGHIFNALLIFWHTIWADRESG